ncbi:hypothetical protein TPA0905_02310 [Streptomyces olivaceus]|nr:hypothetical protein TPA0905_02310 [Streptomyces olivaceus]
MRHTVRRTFRGLEQVTDNGCFARRGTVRAAGSGADPSATPPWRAPRISRIPHKVPERGTDSGP